jgi:uncharacterized protein YndB with AHSA1/START domain
MLGSVRYHVHIDAPVDVVWGIVGDPAAIAGWFPDFESSSVEGTTRTMNATSGFSFTEELLVVDPLLRRVQYTLDLPIMAFHRGTMDVLDLGDDTTVVVYATDADPRIMALVIGSATQRALGEIKDQAEAAVSKEAS